jgi:hypothetical protein
MENIVIITLTSVLAILFIGFGWMTLKEFKEISDGKIEDKEESGPRANMVKFVASLFDEKYTKLPIKERVLFYKQVKRTIADMESDGVYFPEEVKTQLEAKRQSLVCEYSGLPSVQSYLEEI